MGFRANLIEIEIEVAALAQPGWVYNLSRFWREASKMIGPFYGEVRTRSGLVRHGGSVYATPESMRNSDPNARVPKSWWWRGIPPQLGQAAVLGEVYQRLWPEFTAISEIEAGLAFASTPDWSKPVRLSASVPNLLVMPPESRIHQEDKYAECWPFGPPFTSRNR
jgi:hypothetical protein